MRPLATFALALALGGCALSHDPDGDGGAATDTGAAELDAGSVDAGFVDAGFVDAGFVDAGFVDAGFVDAGSADAGPFDCRVITPELAECLTLTEPRCASCHYDPGADRWALCPEGVGPPIAPTVGPTLAECGVGP